MRTKTVLSCTAIAAVLVASAWACGPRGSTTTHAQAASQTPKAQPAPQAPRIPPEIGASEKTPPATPHGATRTEKDLLGEKAVPANAYYGVQTTRALENFQISGI